MYTYIYIYRERERDTHTHIYTYIIRGQSRTRLTICARHPCEGAMLIFSVSFPSLTYDPRRESTTLPPR